MKQYGSPRPRTDSLLGYLFVLSFIFSSSVSYAQTPANFSGVWKQDTVKSDDFYKAFGVMYEITQTPQTFTVKQIFTIESSNESVIREYPFTLDGKVKNIESENGTEKNSATWSADKKTLITRSVITYGSGDVGITETYSLSENGLVLTAVKADVFPGTQPVKMVFNKMK